MKILIIEPFFTGSHASWSKNLKRYSSHEVEILNMKGLFWKWRMHGGAVYLAQEFLKMSFDPDLIIASDMLDLSTFVSLAKDKLKNTKIAMYFHENQLSYPWSPNDKDIKENRDKHYGFINYTSALSADAVFFNSNYHMNSFYSALEDFLCSMPDYKTVENMNKLRSKSSVLPLGLELNKFDEHSNSSKYKEGLVLWNHRWEYDKNPEDFFNALFVLKEKGVPFKLAVIGESFKKNPKIFEKAKKELKENIVAFERAESFSDYASWLHKADILPVTSIQEFFGISVMESIYCNCYPLLPDRLTYPELFDSKVNHCNFYSNFNELVTKLQWSLENIDFIRENSLKHIALKYRWEDKILQYDKIFSQLLR